MSKLISFQIYPREIEQNEELKIILDADEDFTVLFAIRGGSNDSVIFKNGQSEFKEDMYEGINTIFTSISGDSGVIGIYATVDDDPNDELYFEIDLQ